MQKRPFCFLVALCVATEAQAQELRCEISQKYVCEADGCKPSAPTTWNRIDLKKGTYARCEGNNCETYEARISHSGVFTIIELPGRSAMARIADPVAEVAGFKALSFHEVVTQFHTVFVSYGSCKST
jgi:hypothetical protein